MEFGERALELALRSGDQTSAAFERANLAELRLLLDEPDAARDLAEQAFAAAEWERTWCLPYALAALASVRGRAGEHDDAAALLDRAETVVATAGDRQARLVVRLARAEHHLAAADPAAALEILGDGSDGVTGAVLVAWAHLAAGRPEEARRVAAAEAERARAAGEHLDEVDAVVVLATATRRLGRAGEAEGLLAAAGRLADELPYPAGRRRVADARRAGQDAASASSHSPQ